MVILSVALFLELALALFLRLWLVVLWFGAGGWTGATGAGIGGAEGAGWMRVLFPVLALLGELIQLFQQDGGIKFEIVSVAKSLYCLVYGVLALVVEQVGDLYSPVHGLNGNLNCF